MASICFQNFQALPYPIQEYIVDLIDDFCTFLALSVTNRYLSTLSSRSLYETLDFTAEKIGKKRWPDLEPFIRLSNVRYLQRGLVDNLTEYPHTGIFTRSLSWDISDDRSWPYAVTLPTKNIWTAFETMSAVRSLDLKVDVGDEEPAPEVPLFPNLQIARIEGQFPRGSLEKLLHTSPYISELRIVGKNTVEHKGYLRTMGIDITPFLQQSIDNSAFPRLRVLEFCIARRAKLGVVAQFLVQHSASLTDLAIGLTNPDEHSRDVFKTHFLPIFGRDQWPDLKHVRLSGIPVSSDELDVVRGYLPTISSFRAEWQESDTARLLAYNLMNDNAC